MNLIKNKSSNEIKETEDIKKYIKKRFDLYEYLCIKNYDNWKKVNLQETYQTFLNKKN